MDFMHRGVSKEASMDGIVVVGTSLGDWGHLEEERMLKRIASFLLVSVCPAYHLSDIILSVGESICPIQETGKE